MLRLQWLYDHVARHGPIFQARVLNHPTVFVCSHAAVRASWRKALLATGLQLLRVVSLWVFASRVGAVLGFALFVAVLWVFASRVGAVLGFALFVAVRTASPCRRFASRRTTW